MGRSKGYKYKLLEQAKKYSKAKYHLRNHFISQYDFIPIGANDYSKMNREYWNDEENKGDYEYATHLLVVLRPKWTDWCPTICVYTCIQDGSSPTDSPVVISVHKSLERILEKYYQDISKMKNDTFWSD